MIKYIYNQILYLQGSGWFYLEGVWLWRISESTYRRWWGLFFVGNSLECFCCPRSPWRPWGSIFL